MKKILLFAMGLAMSASTLAEETDKVETTIAGDIVSSYICYQGGLRTISD